jgi:hypothetical protein
LNCFQAPPYVRLGLQAPPRGDTARHYFIKERFDVDLARSGNSWLIKQVVVVDF